MAENSKDGWVHHVPPQPRECAICGKPVTMKHGAWFKRFPVPVTWCWRCA